MDYKKYIESVQDFPSKGINFRDITSLLQYGTVYQSAIKELAEFAREKQAEIIAGPEARGFVIASPLALSIGAGFVPIRKKGKLPREVVEVTYQKEYGPDVLAVHKDAIQPGQRVLIADDLLATGGTIEASIELVKRLGGIVVGLAFLIELDELKGRERLGEYDIRSLMTY